MKYIKFFENITKFTYLNDCIRRGTLAELKEMIANGYDVNDGKQGDSKSFISNSFKIPPIIMATAEKKYSMIEELLKSGANVNARHPNDFTALYISITHRESSWSLPHKIRKSLNRFILLVNSGADINNINKNKDIFHYLNDSDIEAIKNECPEIYKEYKFRKTMKKYNL